MPVILKHECQYADAIGVRPYKIEDEQGVEKCGFCHVEWAPKPKTAGGK